MSLLLSATVLRLVDSMSTLLSQAYQLARARLASAASPILRLMVQPDQAVSEVDLLRWEVEVFRAQREGLPPHLRPNYRPAQRLAILQLRRLRGWSIKRTAKNFVLHRNTIRAWIRAAEGKGWPLRPSLDHAISVMRYQTPKSTSCFYYSNLPTLLDLTEASKY